MAEPLVSIIITSYNYGRYIRECIQSCRAQTMEDIEIIVVDDCSTDDSVKIIASEHQQDPRVKLHILDQNMGYSYAKNYGIRHAFGEYLAFIDADDKLTLDSIECRYKWFSPGVDFVHGLALRWYGGDDTRGYNNKTYVHAQGRMYRRNLHEKYGLYYSQLRSMADKEFVYRLGIHPESPLPTLIKAKKIDKVVAWYRKHPDQMHKVRRENHRENKIINTIFNARIKQLRKEGITTNNTEFLNAK